MAYCLCGSSRGQDYVTPRLVSPAKSNIASKGSAGKAKKAVPKTGSVKADSKADSKADGSELVVRFERLGGNDPSPEEDLSNKLLGEVEAWFDSIKALRRPEIVKLSDQSYERHGLTRLVGIGYKIVKATSATFPYEATVRIIMSQRRSKPAETMGAVLSAPLSKNWESVQIIEYAYQRGKWVYIVRSGRDED
jgi:hypothetical protein